MGKKTTGNKPATIDEEKKVERRGGKRNRPDLENYGYEYAEPGDNTRYLRQAMVSLSLPPIDISDPKQVERRIEEYFEFCANNDKKPNKIGMCNWLGVRIETVNSWQRGDYRSITHSPIVKKAMSILHELWVDYMQNGKINPTSGIFLGKNLFGYRDEQEITVTPRDPLGEKPDEEELRQRIVDSIVVEPDEDDY